MNTYKGNGPKVVENDDVVFTQTDTQPDVAQEVQPDTQSDLEQITSGQKFFYSGTAVLGSYLAKHNRLNPIEPLFLGLLIQFDPVRRLPSNRRIHTVKAVPCRVDVMREALRRTWRP